MKRRRFLEGVSVGTAASLAGCPGGAERVETRQTEEPEATGSDSATPEETSTETRGESSDSGVDANWPEFDGLPNLIPEVKKDDYLAIVPGEMRPDYGLEQDPHMWWQIDYDPQSYEQSKMSEDDVGALKNKETVEQGEVTEINGEPLHVVGGNHKYEEQDEWTSLLGTDNEYSKRALGILRAAQRGDGVEVFNVDSGEMLGKMFSEGQPDAIWVTSEYINSSEITVTHFAAIYDEEDSTYSEGIGIWNPEYNDGAITKGTSTGETLKYGEGASWEEILEHMVDDPNTQ